MKKYFLIFLAASCLLLPGCRKDTPAPVPNPQEQKDPEPQEPAVPAPAGFTGVRHGEWVYMIRTQLKDTPSAKKAIALLEKNLDEIDALLPESALTVMHKRPIWLEKDLTDGAAWYHPSKEWLASQGYMTEKWHCVELCNYLHYVSWSNQNQPYMVLHELCHLYHDQALPGGFDNKDVKEAYDKAMKAGLYVNTAYRLDKNTLIEHFDDTYGTKVYATNNPQEYFSEICEAYWGENDYFPFNYEDLKGYDPYGFALMEKVWGARN